MRPDSVYAQLGRGGVFECLGVGFVFHSAQDALAFLQQQREAGGEGGLGELSPDEGDCRTHTWTREMGELNNMRECSSDRSEVTNLLGLTVNENGNKLSDT